jgi:hypothetical protein
MWALSGMARFTGVGWAREEGGMWGGGGGGVGGGAGWKMQSFVWGLRGSVPTLEDEAADAPHKMLLVGDGDVTLVAYAPG